MASRVLMIEERGVLERAGRGDQLFPVVTSERGESEGHPKTGVSGEQARSPKPFPDVG